MVSGDRRDFPLLTTHHSPLTTHHLNLLDSGTANVDNLLVPWTEGNEPHAGTAHLLGVFRLPRNQVSNSPRVGSCAGSGTDPGFAARFAIGARQPAKEARTVLSRVSGT